MKRLKIQKNNTVLFQINGYLNFKPMSVYKICTVMIFAFFLYSTSNGQSPTPEPLSNIMPPSPNAATFTRYGDYPVSYSTGLVDISVPLYEINEENFKLGVNISYHASGRKSAISFSSLGSNWALNAGGMISRTIKGRPDMLPYQKGPAPINVVGPPLTLDNFMQVADMAFDNKIATSTTPESQYDVFNYFMNGKSGKFIIQEGQPVLLSGDPVKVEPLDENSFLLTDENGIKYLFGDDANYNYGGVESALAVPGNTSWLLNSVTLLNGQQINFKYGSAVSSINPAIKIKGNVSNYKKFTFSTNLVYATSTTIDYDIPATSFQDFVMRYVKEINFPKGKMTFSYDSTYITLLSSSIYDALGNVLKTFSFNYQTLPNVTTDNNNALLLSKLSTLNSLGDTVEKYSFGYNMPSNIQMGTSSDWWGYANSSSAGTTPAMQYISMPSGQPVLFGSSDAKTPDFKYKSYGILNQIVYPTGGSTQFIYEPNRYFNKVGVLLEGPGLRIQQILSDDGYGKKL
jgi:hypothetical protein